MLPGPQRPPLPGQGGRGAPWFLQSPPGTRGRFKARSRTFNPGLSVTPSPTRTRVPAAPGASRGRAQRCHCGLGVQAGPAPVGAQPCPSPAGTGSCQPAPRAPSPACCPHLHGLCLAPDDYAKEGKKTTKPIVRIEKKNY